MKNTVSTFLSMKQNGERLTEITSYDYTTAKLVEKSGHQRHSGGRFARHDHDGL